MRRLLFALTLGLAFASTAGAAPISYTCPNNSAECEGQTFALYLVDVQPTYFDIAVSINTAGYTGSETDLAYGVEFKNVTDTNAEYDAISILQAPGNDADWNAFTKQLSQGCELGDNDFNDTGCAAWGASGIGYNFFIGEVLTWVFRVTSDDVPESGDGHIKYQYLTASGGPAAGLLSQDLPLQDCTDPEDCDDDVTPVPEPATALLFALGLGAAARTARRRRL